MLINPSQLNQAIREIRPPRTDSPTTSKTALAKLLEDANLTTPEVLEHVSLMMRGAETDSARLKAAEYGLKLNGLLTAEDESRRDFNVTIIINDADHVGVNPILIPR